MWLKHHLSKGRIIITSGLNMFKPMGGPTLEGTPKGVLAESPGMSGLSLHPPGCAANAVDVIIDAPGHVVDEDVGPQRQ